uniref:Uncharacterized protein n=1 Tax=Arundo donax TaxID=35708 RepID=A0A0A9HPZ2_ARUDO
MWHVNRPSMRTVSTPGYFSLFLYHRVNGKISLY